MVDVGESPTVDRRVRDLHSSLALGGERRAVASVDHGRGLHDQFLGVLRHGDAVIVREIGREHLCRCAEQARHIAGLISLKAEEAAEAEAHSLADAIAVMQTQGVR